MYERVFALFEIYKDVISENREILQTVKSLKSDLEEMCKVIPSSGKSTEEDLEAVKGMQSMQELTKQFSAEKRN